MTFGIDINSKEKSSIENFDRHLYSEYYNSYSIEEIPENIRPYISNNNEVIQDISNSEVINYEETPKPLEGPMDSAWPMYCHDVRNTGRSPYSTVSTDGVEKWRFDTIEECSGSPIIDKEGTIYVGGFYLFAVYTNGTMKWQYTIGGRIVSAPAIDENGILYFGAIWDNKLHAIYSNNGTVKWNYPIGPTWASPTVGPDGIIYVPATDNWNVLAFYPNGTLKWGFHADEKVYSSPAIGDDGTVYCTSYGGYLYALYPGNGTVKWKYNTGGIRTSPCIADDGTIYVVSYTGPIYAFYPNGTLKWSTNVGGGTSPTIGQDGTIYCGYHDLYAINPVNGSIKWVFDPGEGRSIKDGTPCNSLDGTIYFGTYISYSTQPDGGELIAVNPDGTEHWRIFLATDYVMSAPAIGVDGTVYVGSSNDGPPYGWGYLHAIKSNPYAPSVPEISGPVKGKPNVEYTFTFCSTSPVGKDLYYLIYWDDNKDTGWVGPYPSGETISLTHSWYIERDKIIRAWARDTDNLYGGPGEFSITIKARDRATTNSLLLRLLERFPLIQRLLNL